VPLIVLIPEDRDPSGPRSACVCFRALTWSIPLGAWARPMSEIMSRRSTYRLFSSYPKSRAGGNVVHRPTPRRRCMAARSLRPATRAVRAPPRCMHAPSGPSASTPYGRTPAYVVRVRTVVTGRESIERTRNQEHQSRRPQGRVLAAADAYRHQPN
jgi:hypothetical protein